MRPRLLALLACALAAAAEARAAEDPSPPAPAEEPAAPRDGPPDEGATPDENWVDSSHSFVEQRIFAPVLRLDRFFSDERDIEHERAQSFLRWRSEVRFDEVRGARPAFTTGVRANLRLPGLNRQLRRLRVVITGETRDAVSALLPGEDGEATPEEDLGTGDAGLRFDLWDSLVSHADLSGGFLVRLPPGVFGRLRLRRAVPIRKILLARGAVSGFFRSDTEFGTTVSAEVERPLSPVAVTRLGGSATLTEVSPGVEWAAELAALAAIGKRSGAQVGVALSGATDGEVAVVDPLTGLGRLEATPAIARYRVYARLRLDVFRRWLFFEVEPEVAWPWSPAEGRHSEGGLVLRLEVQFHGNEPPPDPPPRPRPRGPEPADPPDPDAPGPPAPEPEAPPAPGPDAPGGDADDASPAG